MADLVVVQADAGTAIVQESAVDIVVIQEDGNTVVVQETSPANIVEVVSVGPQGANATLSVGTVTTGAAGSSASVTNSGSSTQAILDFVIPRGDTGDVTPAALAAQTAAQAAATAAAASQSAAATSASSASSSATSATNSASAAATSATQAANSASSAGGSATAAAASASTATAKATDATTSATSAASSASSASTSASTASTKAAEASTSASNASASASSAANSASSASASASTATTQATSATSSASSASASALLAQDWATKTASEVISGQGYGAKKYAQDAATSASAAAASASSAAAALSSYLPLSGGTLTGNLTFSGSSLRIIGDFTSTSRLLVQTNVANSNTVFGLIPNGSAVNSQFHVWGASDITNAPLGAFTINSAQVQIQSAAAGTGTVLPFRILIGSTEVFRATTSYNILIGSSTDDGINKLQLTGSLGITSSLNFSGTGNRITGDFSNATAASRVAFQSSTLNGNTLVNLIPNGTAAISRWGAHNGSDQANSGVASFGITSVATEIVSTANGTGTTLPFRVVIGSTEAVRVSTGFNFLVGTSTDNGADKLQVNGSAVLAGGLKEARVAMAANDINLLSGNYFTKTISGATTLTVSNVPASGTAASFVLDLTNGGSAAITWWSGVKWAGGTAPTLTAAGRDCLGFFTHDGGTTWTGLLLGKDVK